VALFCRNSVKFQLVGRNAEEDKTVHWKTTALWGGRKVELRETHRAVTPFGGLVAFVEFLRRIGYREAVQEHLAFRLTSPNAIDPAETLTAFLLSVVAGARRFAHSNWLRADAALHAVLGVARFPGDDTVRNLFKRFGQGQCQRFFSGLWAWQLERLPECAAHHSGSPGPKELLLAAGGGEQGPSHIPPWLWPTTLPSTLDVTHAPDGSTNVSGLFSVYA
jgi:hypothetical protein